MLTRENEVLCKLFAETLEYPGSSFSEVVGNCARQLENSFPDIAGPVRSFAAFTATQSPGALEELYTQTFDVTPATTLYLGYHLFGETPKRSVFLVSLTEAFQACSFSAGKELADHLGVVLRFLSVAEDYEFVAPLMEECLLPTLTRMEKELKKNENQYARVISPLKTFVQRVSRDIVKAGGVPNA
ncbi:MAG: molecular chaperone TorD family protein [Dehalococcoidia bacterium]|nr:molecular chaperone TorD family protein [Dehalococcoidia bacterium]